MPTSEKGDDQTQACQVWASLEVKTQQEVLAEFHRVIKEMIDEHFRISTATASESTSGHLCTPVEPQPGDHQQREPADAVGGLIAVGTLAGTSPGTTIFPLGQSLVIVSLAALGCAIGLPVSIMAFNRCKSARKRLSAIIAGLGCLMPLPVSSFALGVVARNVGFELD